MSVNISKRTKTIWDIEFDKQVPDASLVAFNQHKEALLAVLRGANGRGSSPNPSMRANRGEYSVTSPNSIFGMQK